VCLIFGVLASVRVAEVVQKRDLLSCRVHYELMGLTRTR
jgi:hypothetical protein